MRWSGACRGGPDDDGRPGGATTVTAAATRVLFDEPGPRGRARIRLFTVIGLVLVAGLVALILWQFQRSGQLGRSRWVVFLQPD